ncbi:MAG TPA: NAD(P)-dependent oxidoreductase [Bacteroidia bacterium]|jgi:NADH dehydrogenase
MTEKKKMIITGATGFIGSAALRFFRDKGWNVIAFVQSVPAKPESEVVYVKYDLADVPDEGAFADCDALVHCAYLKNDFETNVNGTKRLLELSRKHNVKKNIFISSFSAHPDATSKYGKQKLALEKEFNTGRDCVLRAGVVLGNGGGLFGQMKDHVQKGKRIPLIDGGTQPLQIIDVNDLVMIIGKVIENDLQGIFTIARPEAVTYKEFFIALGKRFNTKVKFISVPFFLVNWGLAFAELLHLKLPVNRENVQGLKFIRLRETKADLEKLNVKLKSFEASLDGLR